VLVTVSHFHPSLIFAGKAVAYQIKATKLHCEDRLLDLHFKIGLGWKCPTITNTLAYYNAVIITAV
jgi:hypothetical protein